jgi:hypothetical protein
MEIRQMMAIPQSKIDFSGAGCVPILVLSFLPWLIMLIGLLDIPIPAHLMAVADVYNALIRRRVYKVSTSQEEAVQIMLEERGTATISAEEPVRPTILIVDDPPLNIA